MNPKICPTCHHPIPENAPGGLCPSCILRDADEIPTHGHGAPSIDQIAAAFPQLDHISLIGQGGMGFVYKARQPKLDRTIALKILAPELSRDPTFAERFAREARTLGKLQHPSIVTIYEHGECGGFYYLMMEYVDGVNLRQAMRAGRFTPTQALTIVPGICDALQFAHEQGVWHRDIKPENILLDRDGRVKIADFGIARIVGDPQRDFTLTMTGNALGSVAYMAPEQHEKPHDVDHRADIYSLGVVIYEMLTGELPLGRFPSPSQRAAVDARIDEIVLKTLEKERELRQQSVTEVKTDMHRAMQPGVPQKATSATSNTSGRGLGKLAFGLFLFGITIPFLLWIISIRAAEIGFMLSALIMVVTLILGFMSWRDKLGKVSAILSLFVLLLYGAFITMSSRGAGNIPNQIASMEGPKSDEPQDPAPAAAPAVSVEDVFRNANEAANESNGEEFAKHMLFNKIITYPIRHDSYEGHLSAPSVQTAENLSYFHGLILSLKVTTLPGDRNARPVAFVKLKKPDESISYIAVRFRPDPFENKWFGSSAWLAQYRSVVHIDFKPTTGNAFSIVKTHLQDEWKFRPVEGRQDQFYVFGFGESGYAAQTIATMEVEELHESLKKFGLETALSILSPANLPDAPWMAEDAPPFVEPKP